MAHELTKEYLFKQYIDLNKTRTQIEKETGVPSQRIGSLLQQYGIRRYHANRHGLSRHPLNTIWRGMKERCLNQNADNYEWYGGRGITVCQEWNEFIPFYNWAMNNGWEPGLTIDRINTNEPYMPGNCRFVPMKSQFRNRRSNVGITVDGETRLQCEWEELLGLKKKIIAKWKYKHGMDYVIAMIREERRRAS